jgi:hypothetical protein
MPDKSPPPIRGSYWVLPGRLLAGEYPGEIEPQRTSANLRALLAGGIRTFVDLTEEGEVAGIISAVPSYRRVLREIATQQFIPITCANIPIVDRGVPSPWTLRCILELIDRSIADENPVYVHCLAGRGRTGTVVGCYLRRHGLAQSNNVIQKLAGLRRDLYSAKEASPQTQEQVNLVTHWKEGN